MKKVFFGVVTLIVSCFAFLSCMSYSGHSRLYRTVPMEESCVVYLDIPYEAAHSYTNLYQIVDDKYVTRLGNIIPAGRYLITGRYRWYSGSGQYYTQVIDHGSYTTSERKESISWNNIYFSTIVDFKPSCYYGVFFGDKDSFSAITVLPTETEGIYADTDGNLYPSEKCTIYREGGVNYIYTYQVTQGEKQLGKTYSSSEAEKFLWFGLQHLNTLGLQFGNSYGFKYFSDPLNIHVNGEWGLGVGLGFSEYDFSSFDNAAKNMGGSFPINVGVNVDFDLNNKHIYQMGLGGGYLLTPFVGRDKMIYGTPYVQARINNEFYVEYYFSPGWVVHYIDSARQNTGKAPLYSAFGLGGKVSF